VMIRLCRGMSQGRAQDCSLGAKVEGRERGEVLEEGAATPSPPARGLGERCELSQWGSTAQRFSTTFTTQDGLSSHYNIVNCGLS